MMTENVPVPFFIHTAFIVVAVAWLGTDSRSQSSLADTTVDSTLSEAHLRKIFTDAVTQSNTFYKTEGFPVPAPSPQLCSFKFKWNQTYQETAGEFDSTGQALVSGEILARSGKFVSFYNEAAIAAYASLPKVEIPPQPKWTKNQAIKIASDFADIFTKAWGEKVGHPVATYNIIGHDVNKETGKLLTAPGQWKVTWLQQTPSGIFYQSGGVTVLLSEEYGPDSLSVNFSSQYVDEHFAPIAKDKALIEGRKGLNKILAWGPAKTALGSVRVLDAPPPFAILMIVQPNNITMQPSIEGGAASNQLKALSLGSYL